MNHQCNSQQKCPICLEALLQCKPVNTNKNPFNFSSSSSSSNNDNMIGVPADCGHCFHAECWKEWERTCTKHGRLPKCPVCNTIVSKGFVPIYLNATENPLLVDLDEDSSEDGKKVSGEENKDGAESEGDEDNRHDTSTTVTSTSTTTSSSNEEEDDDEEAPSIRGVARLTRQFERATKLKHDQRMNMKTSEYQKRVLRQQAFQLGQLRMENQHLKSLLQDTQTSQDAHPENTSVASPSFFSFDNGDDDTRETRQQGDTFHHPPIDFNAVLRGAFTTHWPYVRSTGPSMHTNSSSSSTTVNNNTSTNIPTPSNNHQTTRASFTTSTSTSSNRNRPAFVFGDAPVLVQTTPITTTRRRSRRIVTARRNITSVANPRNNNDSGTTTYTTTAVRNTRNRTSTTSTTSSPSTSTSTSSNILHVSGNGYTFGTTAFGNVTGRVVTNHVSNHVVVGESVSHTPPSRSSSRVHQSDASPARNNRGNNGRDGRRAVRNLTTNDDEPRVEWVHPAMEEYVSTPRPYPRRSARVAAHRANSRSSAY